MPRVASCTPPRGRDRTERRRPERARHGSSRTTGARPASRDARCGYLLGGRAALATRWRSRRRGICTRGRSTSRARTSERRAIRLERGSRDGGSRGLRRAQGASSASSGARAPRAQRGRGAHGAGASAMWTGGHGGDVRVGERAVELASARGTRSRGARARGAERGATAMRGDAGDLARAVEIGERALAGWLRAPGPTSSRSTTTCRSTVNYWMGELRAGARARALEGSRSGGLGPHSAEFLLAELRA